MEHLKSHNFSLLCMCDFVFLFFFCCIDVNSRPAAQQYSRWMSPVSCQPAAASVSTATIKGYFTSMFSSVTCIYEPNRQRAKFISSLLKPEWWLLDSTDVILFWFLCFFSHYSNSENLSQLFTYKNDLSISWHIVYHAHTVVCLCDWLETFLTNSSRVGTLILSWVKFKSDTHLQGEKMRFCLFVIHFRVKVTFHLIIPSYSLEFLTNNFYWI